MNEYRTERADRQRGATEPAVADVPTVRIRLLSDRVRAEAPRVREPITVGLPFPRGAVRGPAQLSLFQSSAPMPLQARELERWADGSIRWALLDFQADVGGSAECELRVEPAKDDPPASAGLALTEDGGLFTVSTGAALFRIRSGGRFPFEEVTAAGIPVIDADRSGLFVVDRTGAACVTTIDRVEVEERGVVRAVVVVDGRIVRDDQTVLELRTRLHFFAGSATVRFDLRVRNPRRATHAGGLWDLGDPGSVFIRDLRLKLALPPGEPAELGWSVAPDVPFERGAGAFELYQDSSGGENWQSTNHVNRDRRVPTTFRGYRLRTGGSERRGLRATPVVALTRGKAHLAIAVPRFWENFPKAIECAGGELAVALFPCQFADLHEIQGGEQKTHTVFVAFAPDRVTEQPLAWCISPTVGRADPDWYCSSGALPYLVPAAENRDREFLELVDVAIAGPHSFERKREVIDDYGWRHFGDIYADHETVFAPPRDSTLVSHYNNQYDSIAGFAAQFLSSGDARWHRAMDELAAHVVDIDIYHTTEDKSAYNHGLFWHTYHYVDADTATHRSFPAISKAVVHGGGPSAEHNYAAGLMLHYFLTGSEESRRAAIDLAQFVVDIDDGRKTVFRWLDRGATGLASASGALTYHGPGRASANSISALIDGHRLTGNAAFLDKAEQLIRRCIHPADDIAARDLFDSERKWFYTVFLQALGKYLDHKVDRGELDRMYAYGRESLLHYARWAAAHERPYLDRPEVLQYPTETWAAQDIRKSDVLAYAAKHSSGEERTAFVARSDFFFRYSVATLKAMPTSTFTRPVAILLTSGRLHAAFHNDPAIAAPAPAAVSSAWPAPESFVPQRIRAIRRVRALVVAGGVALVVLLFLIALVLR